MCFNVVGRARWSPAVTPRPVKKSYLRVALPCFFTGRVCSVPGLAAVVSRENIVVTPSTAAPLGLLLQQLLLLLLCGLCVCRPSRQEPCGCPRQTSTGFCRAHPRSSESDHRRAHADDIDLPKGSLKCNAPGHARETKELTPEVDQPQCGEIIQARQDRCGKCQTSRD